MSNKAPVSVAAQILPFGINGDTYLTIASRVGHLRFTFTPGANSSSSATPYILIDAVRQSIQKDNPANITFPVGSVSISQSHNEICGSSNERQDSIITPISIKEPASHFKGFFCARFDIPLPGQGKTGIIANGTLLSGKMATTGSLLNAFALFPMARGNGKDFVVNVKIGTSFISEDQARRNIDLEIPDSLGDIGLLDPTPDVSEPPC